MTSTGPPDRPQVEPLPPPPWRSTPSVVRRRDPLTQEAIVDAALRLLDQQGLEGLSMRRLGEQLDTGPSSLYAHIRNKDELLDLLFDRVAAELHMPEPDPTRWQEQLQEFMRRSRLLMLEHRDIARISIGRIPVGPNVLRWVEWILHLLREAGFPDKVAAYAGDLLGLYIGAYAFEESLGMASPVGEDLPPNEIREMIREYYTSLPPDRFPHLTSMVDLLMSGDQDERFEFGMKTLIAGLESLATAEDSEAR